MALTTEEYARLTELSDNFQNIYLKREDIQNKENIIEKLNIDESVKLRILEYYALAAQCRKTVINNIQSNINTELDSIPNGAITEYLNNEGISQPTKNFSSFLLGLSNELLLKCLYVLNEYETLERDFKNPHISTEGCSNLCDYCFKKARNEYSGVNDLNSKFDLSFVPNDRPRNNNPINVTATDTTAQETLAGKNNGHQLYYLLENISDKSIVDLIKYETTMFSSKKGVLDENLPKTKDFIQAAEIMSILKSFNPEDELKKYNKDMIANSSAFEGDRYFERLSKIEDGLFLNSSICATHEIFCYILNKRVFNAEYSNNSSVIRDKRKLISDIDNNKELTYEETDILENNFEIFDLARIFIYLNIDEIKGIIKGYDSFLEKNKRSLSQYLNYFLFIKTYIKEIYNLYDKNTIPNVSKFFESIIKSNDISKLGEQYRNWFNKIDINKLSVEEFIILDNIDSDYIYNSLDIIHKIIYKKCKKYNLNFLSNIDYFSDTIDLTNQEFVYLREIAENQHIPMKYIVNLYKTKERQDFEKIINDSLKNNNLAFETNHEDLKRVLNQIINAINDNIKYCKQAISIDKKTITKLDEGINNIIQLERYYEKFSNSSSIKDKKTLLKTKNEYKNEKENLLLEIEKDTKKIEILKNKVKVYVNELKKIQKNDYDSHFSIDDFALEYINKIVSDEKVKKIGVDIFDYYYLEIEYGSELAEKIMHISQKTKIPLSSFYNMQKEKDINLLENINLIEAKDDMLVLDYSQLFENISLVGSVGNYIFYKTPEQIEEIQKLCQDKNIDFKNEFLYFDIGYLKNNIKYVNFVLKLQIGELNVDNVDDFIASIKAGVNACSDLKNDLQNALIKQSINTQEDGSNTNNVEFIWEEIKNKKGDNKEKQV